jgi:hypothetical protein
VEDLVESALLCGGAINFFQQTTAEEEREVANGREIVMSFAFHTIHLMVYRRLWMDLSSNYFILRGCEIF